MHTRCREHVRVKKETIYVYFLSLCHQLFPRHRMEISSMTEMVCYLYLEAFYSICTWTYGIFSVIFSWKKRWFSHIFSCMLRDLFVFVFCFSHTAFEVRTVATTERFIVLWTIWLDWCESPRPTAFIISPQLFNGLLMMAH